MLTEKNRIYVVSGRTKRGKRLYDLSSAVDYLYRSCGLPKYLMGYYYSLLRGLMVGSVIEDTIYDFVVFVAEEDANHGND